MLVQEKFVQMRKDMSSALIERDEEIDVVLTAMICQENPLLVGPPGTAKSMLLDSIMEWVDGEKFPILFNKYTVPEEVFGPISVKGLKDDTYRRVTTKMLPQAHVAYLDEIFKASSAILNTLLKALNERTFINAGEVTRIPLLVAVAASNEWPNDDHGGKELSALFDRFLLRAHGELHRTGEGRKRLLWVRDHKPVLTTKITPVEVVQANTEAKAIKWTEPAMEAFEKIVDELKKEGVQPGDRRQFKSVGACQAFAYLSGEAQVETEHLEVLAHTMWVDPAEQPAKCAQVVARIANPVGMRVNTHLMEVEQIMAATNMSELADSVKATKKLQEIGRKLAAIPSGNGRVERAKEYVASLIKKIRLATVETM